MELITAEQRSSLIRDFTRSAFHLELKDEYGVPEEDEPVARWRKGEQDDFAWLEPWLAQMREATQAGKTVRRVRVITEPLTDYIRWEHEGTWRNQEAGEDIRWLPRHRVPEGMAFPAGGNDWWLIDDRILIVTYFHESGRVDAYEQVTDPSAVAECIGTRDRLWAIAIPHDEYQPA